MSHLRITGGRPLRGTVRTLGAKNSALALLAGTLVCEGSTELRNVPRLADVSAMLRLLEAVGATCDTGPYEEGQMSVVVRTEAVHGGEAVPAELMGAMRSSVYLLGALLGRTGRARLAYPGGCQIGARPIDLHLEGLRALGARIEAGDDGIAAVAPPGGLEGTTIRLAFPSVGATVNLLLAAVRARGRTVLANAAREPEIVDLARFLNLAGASVQGAGTSVVVVDGRAHLDGVRMAVMPDRIEAGTLLVAGAATGGEIYLKGPVARYLRTPIEVLRRTGAQVETSQDGIALEGPPGGRPLGADIETQPYPGFPTDLQPVFLAYLARARGPSVVRETIFENRFRHVPGLREMGAKIRVTGRTAIVEGVARLEGHDVTATDLRAAGAFVVAALAAEGTTRLFGVHHLDRGYQDITERLAALGAEAVRTDAPPLRRVEAEVS